MRRTSEQVKYIVFKDVSRDQGFVHAGIFVGLEMHECIFRYAFMDSGT